MGRESLRQRILAGMAKWRVADVVGKTQRLGQILVQPQRPGDHPADLRHLQTVGKAHAIVVAIGGDEHLRLVAQAAEGDGMDDAVAVALIDAAGPARDGPFQCELAPARLGRITG